MKSHESFLFYALKSEQISEENQCTKQTKNRIEFRRKRP